MAKKLSVQIYFFAVEYLGRLSHTCERRPRCLQSGGLGGWAPDEACRLSGIPSYDLSYHGFIGVSTTLEFKNPIGICWVALGVFADGPFFRLSLHLFAFLFIFASCSTWQRRKMLVGELPTATPGNKGKAASPVTCSPRWGSLSGSIAPEQDQTNTLLIQLYWGQKCPLWWPFSR